MKRTPSRWIAVVMAVALLSSLGAAQAASNTTDGENSTEFVFIGQYDAKAHHPFSVRATGFALVLRTVSALTTRLSPTLRMPHLLRSLRSFDSLAPAPAAAKDPREKELKILDGPEPF